MTEARRPVLAVTMGDPAGIGPEIVVRAAAAGDMRSVCRPVIVGDLRLLERWRERLAPGLRLVPVERPAAADPPEGTVEVVDPRPLAGEGPAPGRPDAESGRAALACIERGAALAVEGAADALVTAPIGKAAIRLAGSPFPGHTEMLAHLTGAREYAMMFSGGGLRVSLATIHIPLARVPLELDAGRLASVIALTARAAADMGFPSPRLAVCGLNPHAGEGGLFGREEEEIIRPAVAAARAAGWNASDPLPGDTVFHRALAGDFDAVVAMYHDQGLAPFKTVAFDTGVNITLGLPIIRTSVDHGTAYDIAGRGTARDTSLREAMKLAALMAAHRRPAGGAGGGAARP